jgi:hypothetical protein
MNDMTQNKLYSSFFFFLSKVYIHDLEVSEHALEGDCAILASSSFNFITSHEWMVLPQVTAMSHYLPQAEEQQNQQGQLVMDGKLQHCEPT